MNRSELPEHVLRQRAIVYVRQSTTEQVRNNLESQHRQYELAELARTHGFRDVVVVDEDLGRSASGTADRPGFRSLIAQICEGTVGAVLCLEASRLARNGREWHHLLELCGLVETYVVDTEGIYNPSCPNDRLLLGLKGTMSEFELTTLRKRMLEGALAKARRGELRTEVVVGYVWSRDLGLMMDPDQRVQDAVHLIFRLFDRLGSARQVMIHMHREQLLFPLRGRAGTRRRWASPSITAVLYVLKNPFYAGAYAYGKTQTKTKIVDGLARKSAGHPRPRGEWGILIRDHHEAYISWDQFEHNQAQLARNAYSKRSGGSKSARGGQALLSGLLRCARCGRMLKIHYQKGGGARYWCRVPSGAAGTCQSFGVRRPDEAVGREILLAVQPIAVEAARVAEAESQSRVDDRRRALELELEQARYQVTLAKRRYESVDPENRLVAAELESRWNAAIARARDCEARLAVETTDRKPAVARESLLLLAEDLESAWNAPTSDMRTKQRLVRALIEEIVVDVDDGRREVLLTIHWRGGQHSQVRVRKPASGEHGCRNTGQAMDIIREMAARWSDTAIAATLNRMGIRTGKGSTWTAGRVESARKKAGIRAYESGPGGPCLTATAAAEKLGVTTQAVRKLIREGILPAHQVVREAPWQIKPSDLERPEVRHALANRQRRRGRPCRNSADTKTLEIPGIPEGER